MKKTQYILAMVCVTLMGCSCTKQFPLQPNEKIEFQSIARANQFRLESGNDPLAITNSTVTITTPTSILPKR